MTHLLFVLFIKYPKNVFGFGNLIVMYQILAYLLGMAIKLTTGS